MGSNIKLHTLASTSSSQLINNIAEKNYVADSINTIETRETDLIKRVETLEKQVLGYKLKNQELENKIQELENILNATNCQIMNILNNKVEMGQYTYDTNNINNKIQDLESKTSHNTLIIYDLEENVKQLKEENK